MARWPRPGRDMRSPVPSTVLGISAGFHDAAAALLVDGEIVAAVEEERLTRQKHDPGFPARAIDCCLAIASLAPDDVDVVAFHEKPLDVLGRHLTSRLASGPSAAGGLILRTPRFAKGQINVGRQLDAWFRDRGAAPKPVAYVEHHTSHAAAAFFPSPFRSAAVLTVDGVGEWATAALGQAHDHRLVLERELRYPDSVGLLYSAFTSYCGFKVNGGEGELMGLAPFGRPVHAQTIRERLVVLRDDGSIHLDQRYFAYPRGRSTTNRRFHDLFGGPPRPLGSTPGQREADLAASVQVVLEEIVLAMAEELHRTSGLDALCIGGGVALNCVANGRVARDGPFGQIWVQPAAGDAGNALGAALWTWHETLGNRRLADPADAMGGSFLGPEFSDDEVLAWLTREGIDHEAFESADEVDRLVAERLAEGAVVGWFQGRMEFGPRALGHRSILADARSATVQGRINDLIKDRAGFRPFAPAVLADRASEWFDLAGEAPYMNLAVAVQARHRVESEQPADAEAPLEVRVTEVRSSVPAITHVDGSARVQTVDRVRNPRFAGLLEAFERSTGCPLLLNTSFNGHDEPIVCTPADAYATFRSTGLDLLVVGNHLVRAS